MLELSEKTKARQMKNTFQKAERLNSRKIINELFEKGSTNVENMFVYPFRVVYNTQPPISEQLPAILISVSKRNFKKAVDRNLLKRRIKEAYRLNKGLLANNFPGTFSLIYSSREIEPFTLIESKLITILKKLNIIFEESSH